MKKQLSKPIKRSFSSWTKDDLRLLLQVKQTDDCRHIDAWIANTNDQTINEFEQLNLDWLLSVMEKRIELWKEAELRDQFISNIATLVDFYSDEHFFNCFSERTLSATVNDIELSGKVDWMVAYGEEYPRQPYFFLYTNTKKKKEITNLFLDERNSIPL